MAPVEADLPNAQYIDQPWGPRGGTGQDQTARLRLDDQENELNVRCVGAPVFDQSGRVVGGMSVSALAFQLPLADARKLAPAVVAAAQQLTLLLSGSSGTVRWPDVLNGDISVGADGELRGKAEESRAR